MAVKSVTFHRGGVHPLEREHHGKTRSQGEAIRSVPAGQVAVSYTHLTLPTIA